MKIVVKKTVMGKSLVTGTPRPLEAGNLYLNPEAELMDKSLDAGDLKLDPLVKLMIKP